jgi:hypothetical protein
VRILHFTAKKGFVGEMNGRVKSNSNIRLFSSIRSACNLSSSRGRTPAPAPAPALSLVGTHCGKKDTETNEENG